MFGEIAEQPVHAGEIGAVDQIPALLFNADQAGMGQLLQMEGQRIPCDTELVRQHAGREARRAGDNQGAESAQPLGVGKAGERGDDLIFFH
ncbi:hypothetical protein AW878_04110 [Bordetella pseudohinzii]|uniref:Uncharacterized protein n=1 Tax=Bordetella pseudohinzii TaxID=1331258 RepID=A0ABM6DI39_9BORD|nr:hypothetical protein BBN53_17710 [Bordetella pseudohinzii]KMM25781.1 hypothetical protein L540_19300 [Bordetella pseudohinzii]KXA81769.1 hypothetical protein AW878_04110 [Bordetella pseudohinzii]KXA82991.1 hypothetical protein AW877_00245 [Bordetella pseudohinzii]